MKEMNPRLAIDRLAYCNRICTAKTDKSKLSFSLRAEIAKIRAVLAGKKAK